MEGCYADTFRCGNKVRLTMEVDIYISYCGHGWEVDNGSCPLLDEGGNMKRWVERTKLKSETGHGNRSRSEGGVCAFMFVEIKVKLKIDGLLMSTAHQFSILCQHKDWKWFLYGRYCTGMYSVQMARLCCSSSVPMQNSSTYTEEMRIEEMGEK